MIVFLLIIIIALLTGPGRAFLGALLGALGPISWLLGAWLAFIVVLGAGAELHSRIGTWGVVVAVVALLAGATYLGRDAIRYMVTGDPEVEARWEAQDAAHRARLEAQRKESNARWGE